MYSKEKINILDLFKGLFINDGGTIKLRSKITTDILISSTTIPNETLSLKEPIFIDTLDGNTFKLNLLRIN